MRMRIALVSLALLGSVGAADGSPRAIVGPDVRAAVERSGAARIVVAFRETRAARSIAATVTSAREVRERVLARVGTGFRPRVRWDAVGATAGDVTAAALRRLLADPDVRRIDLDRGGGRGGDAESLPLIRGDAAHAAGFTGRGVTVAVLDSGLDRTHPDLADADVAEHCFVPPTGCPNGTGEQDGPGSAADDHGHGTNVTGIVTSNGRIAPIGVAQDASIVSVKVLDSSLRFGSSSQIVSALNWIALNRPDVKVVNMSLGSDQLFAGTCDDATAWTMAYASVVRTLRARGVTIFASSMNNRSSTSIAAPACVADVVAVGAVYDSAFGPYQGFCADPVTAPDKVTCFSNSSPALDLLAPGAWITSTGRGSGLSTFGGTSQAAPHAAGAAALLLQADPTLAPERVESLLKTTGRPVVDPRNGASTPRIDIAAALDALRGQPAVAHAVLSARTIAFGSVRVGRTVGRTIALQNTGTGPLTVDVRPVAAPFGLRTPASQTIEPGGRTTIAVVFRPRRAGRYRATLALTTNDPAAPHVAVTLSGRALRR